MKKEILVFNKRFLILALSTVIVFTSVFNSYKIAANATSFVIGGITYTVSEVLAWLGATVLGITGISFIASDDYSKLIEIGYEAAKAMDAELDNTQEWLFATMDKDGAAYFYANNYFDAIQTCDIESIISSSAELSNDFAIFATDALWDLLFDLGADIEAKVVAGEETFLDEFFLEYGYDGTQTPNAAGQYTPLGKIVSPNYSGSDGELWSIGTQTIVAGNLSNGPVAAYFMDTGSVNDFGYSTFPLALYCYDGVVEPLYVQRTVHTYRFSDGKEFENSGTSNVLYSETCSFSEVKIDFNFPVFRTYEAMENYLLTGDDAACINLSQVYRIPEWFDGVHHGDVSDVIVKNPALVGDYVGGMLNAFGTSVREQALAGEFPDVIDTSIGANPFDKPDVITTSYVGELDVPWNPDVPAVDYPGIADSDLPWTNTWAGTDVGNPDIPATGEPDVNPEEPSDDDLDPMDTFGLNTIFNIFVLLISIIIMLLIIFINCLAFIVMVFRIEATTGFLPDEMVAGLDYLRNLEIPGFGMSVYSFFMTLVYILLFFSIVGILRKNIDKIKFPRKGGKK